MFTPRMWLKLGYYTERGPTYSRRKKSPTNTNCVSKGGYITIMGMIQVGVRVSCIVNCPQEMYSQVSQGINMWWSGGKCVTGWSMLVCGAVTVLYTSITIYSSWFIIKRAIIILKVANYIGAFSGAFPGTFPCAFLVHVQCACIVNKSLFCAIKIVLSVCHTVPNINYIAIRLKFKRLI